MFISRVGRDHPRRCGENNELMIYAVIYGGSPPQVRGKLKISFANSHDSRITPAGAGKTATTRAVEQQR